MMKKGHLMLLAFLAVGLVTVCYAAEWQTVKTFTGSTSQTTSSFSIPTNEWRINWNFTLDTAYPDSSQFRLDAYAEGNTTAVASVSSFVLTGGPRSGTLNIHEGSKNYYIKITSAHTPSYSVTVEYTSSAAPTPTASPTPSPEPTGAGGGLPPEAFYAAAIIVVVVIIVIAFVVLRKRVR